MTMTDPRWTVTTDAWTLRAMRDAKAFRDANPSVDDEGQAVTDDYLDRYLAACEEAAAAVGSAEERPVADAPAAPRRTGNGSSNYGGQAATGASEAQANFIRSLARDLGLTEETTDAALARCKTKGDASKLIDTMKGELATRRREGTIPAAPERKATERQRELIANLLTERVYEPEVDVDSLNPAQASELIDRLFAAPRAKVAAHGIREGRYAYSPDGGTTADHYRVCRNGRIVVWTAGGEYPYNGKLNEGLEWIKANPREAAELFGRLVGSCGRCGRDLSDDDSRARGLGPVCAGKSDW